MPSGHLRWVLLPCGGYVLFGYAHLLLFFFLGSLFRGCATLALPVWRRDAPSKRSRIQEQLRLNLQH